MTIIAHREDYRVEFNGSGTWIVLDKWNECLGYYPTERRALNALNKKAALAGQ